MSAAAVLADLFHEAAQSKVQCLPAIIIAPLSTLDTWKSELAQSAAAALRVVVYAAPRPTVSFCHIFGRYNGDATARARVLDGNKFDIIITNPDVLVRDRTPPCAAPDCDTFCPDCDTFRLGSRAARAVAAHGVVLHGGRRGTQAEECRLVLARSAQRRLCVQAKNAAYRYSRPQQPERIGRFASLLQPFLIPNRILLPIAHGRGPRPCYRKSCLRALSPAPH
jgi:hypothetical protein